MSKKFSKNATISYWEMWKRKVKKIKNQKKEHKFLLAALFSFVSFVGLASCGGGGSQVSQTSSVSSSDYVLHPLNKVTPRKKSELIPMIASRSYYTLRNSRRNLVFFIPTNRAFFVNEANPNFDFFPIRFKSLGEVEYRDKSYWRDGELITEVEVVKPSYVVLVFEAVKAVVLTTQEGEEFVFDSDDFDQELVGPTYVNVTYLRSKNPRSINSDFFRETLQKARKFSVAAREGYWANTSGEKTEYRLNIRDIYHSFLSSLLTDGQIRHRYGGSLELDQKFLPDDESFFDPKAQFEGLYLLNLYDVNYQSAFDIDGLTSQRPIETLNINGKDTEVFSLYLKEGVKPNGQFELFFFKLFLGSFFVSQPSEFIQQQAKIDKEKSVGEGIANIIGYYWYGKHLNESLFAAAYIPISQDKVGSLVTRKYRKNPHYWDKEFVQNPNTISDITIDYDFFETSKYSEAVSANFIQGQSIFVRLSTLSPIDIDKILTDTHPQISKDRVVYRKSANITGISQHQVFVTSPSPLIGEENNHKTDVSLYSFNDTFSRFMYGAPRDVLARGEAKTLKAFFGPDQISFRSLLLASVNWISEAEQRVTNSNEFFYSLTLAPRDAKFNGSDQKTSKYQTIFSDLELANTSFVVVEGKRVFEVPYSANLEGGKALTITESLMGGGKKLYQKLQKEMTQLLDKVWAKNGFGEEEKLEFATTFYTTSYSEVASKIIERVVETINNLDLKGRLAFKFQKFYDRKTLFEFLNFGRSIRKRLSWSTDWEGAGGYVQGFFANGLKNLFYLAFFAELAKREESDSNNAFPLLTRLAKLFKKAIDEGRLKFKIPFEEWMELTNKESHHITKFLAFDQTDVVVDVSRFLLDVQRKFTNQEWARLYVEISVLVGPKWDVTSLTYNPLQGERWLIQKGLHFPADNSSCLCYQDFWFDPIID